MNISTFPRTGDLNALRARQPHQAQPSSGLRFGCRLFAYVSPAPTKGQDEFIRQCLLTGGNSMKHQNQLSVGEEGDTSELAHSDFDGLIKENGVRKAGWGIAFASQGIASGEAVDLTMEKSYKPTWQDPHYDEVAEMAASSKPQVVLAHLREAYNSDSMAPHARNAHPFRMDDWALMQHGDYPTSVKDGLESRLNQWHAQDSNIVLPQGEVDSERIACYLAAKLRQQHGSAKFKALTTEQVRKSFQQSMSEIIRWDQSASLWGRTYPGTYNLVMSEGNRVFATHYGPSSRMWLGQHRNSEGKEELLLTTDKIQPAPSAGLSEISWQSVPHNTLLTLERTQDEQGAAQVTYRLDPLLDEDVQANKASGGLFARMNKGLRAVAASLNRQVKTAWNATRTFITKLWNSVRNGLRYVMSGFKSTKPPEQS